MCFLMDLFLYVQWHYILISLLMIFQYIHGHHIFLACFHHQAMSSECLMIGKENHGDVPVRFPLYSASRPVHSVTAPFQLSHVRWALRREQQEGKVLQSLSINGSR